MSYKHISIATLILALLIAVCPAQMAARTAQNGTQDGASGDSLVAAARKAREQQKTASKPSKVLTNDDLGAGTVSVVGTAASAPTSQTSEGTPTAATGAASDEEKKWRDRFGKLNHKLEQDQAALDVLQRELAVLNTQYYGGDPMKGMQQGFSQQDIIDKTAKIDAKKKDIDADKQAIDDADGDLRKAGGDPGWER